MLFIFSNYAIVPIANMRAFSAAFFFVLHCGYIMQLSQHGELLLVWQSKIIV
jgi:hypothetical protein